jgi:hypothetical protein
MEQGGLLFSEEQSLKMKAKLSTFAMQKDTGFHAVPSGGELPFRTYSDYLIVVQGSLAARRQAKTESHNRYRYRSERNR